MTTEDTGGLVDFAGKVLHGGDALLAAGDAIRRADPGEGAFGATGPGALGELCRQLRGQWTAAVDARAREADDHGTALVTTAESLAKVAAHYTDTDITLSTEIADSSLPDPMEPRPRSLTVHPGEAT